MSNNANLINQTSGEVEFGTDPRIINAARLAMGRIDLDPASSDHWNQTIQATWFFTKSDNSLDKFWYKPGIKSPSRVWMNHPFHGGWKACDENCKRKSCTKRGHIYEDIPSNADWIDKLVLEYNLGHVEEACCITFASTSEAWFQPLAHFPQCYLSPRTNYYKPDGTLLEGVTKGSVVTYLGRNVYAFASAFKMFGVCKGKIAC